MCAADGAVDAAPLTYCCQAGLHEPNDFMAELLALAAHVHREVYPLGNDVDLAGVEGGDGSENEE